MSIFSVCGRAWPALLGSKPGSPSRIAALLQQSEADLSEIRSLIYGGGQPSTMPIGDHSGPGSYPPLLGPPTFCNSDGVPIPFTPTETSRWAQLIADARFIVQNRANPAEASQVTSARNDYQHRATNQIVTGASGNEASPVGDPD